MIQVSVLELQYNSLLYATLATFCFTEDISLKNIFRKAFNPVMVSVSKVGDFVRKNQELILTTLGVGVVANLIAVPITGFLARSFGLLGEIVGGLFTGLVLTPLIIFGMVSHARINALNEHQKLIRIIAEFYLSKLVQTIPKSRIREVLIENNKITKYWKQRASRQELMNLITSENLQSDLEAKVFDLVGAGSWTWTIETLKIITNYKNGFYKLGRKAFADRFTGEKSLFSAFTMETLTEFFIEYHSPETSRTKKVEILKHINAYCRRHNLNSYDYIKGSPIWVLGKELQRIISKQKGEFVPLSTVGKLMFSGDTTIFSETHQRINNHPRQIRRDTLLKILTRCEAYITDQNDLNYMRQMISLMGYSSDIILLTEKNHPKRQESELKDKIAEKLKPLSKIENWNEDIPNFVELTSFFGVDFGKKIWLSKKDIYNIFTHSDLNTIAKVLKSKLAPVDPKGCKELLLELGQYDPALRLFEIESKYPSYDDWLDYREKAIYGDSTTHLPINWKTLREKSKILFYTQQGEHIINDIPYVFDAFTGIVCRKDEIYPNSKLSAWNLHHIDWNEENNNFDNFLWVMKRPDLLQGKTSHLTNINDPLQKRKYIAQGMMIKLAFKNGYAPFLWNSLERENYYHILRIYPRRYITD